MFTSRSVYCVYEISHLKEPKGCLPNMPEHLITKLILHYTCMDQLILLITESDCSQNVTWSAEPPRCARHSRWLPRTSKIGLRSLTDPGRPITY